MEMKKEHLGREMIKYSLPLIFSGLLQQLYNWADGLIVGNVNGEVALAAIGCSSVIITVFVMAIMGFTSGISILAAHRWGEKLYDAERKILFTFLIIVTGVIAFFTVISVFLTGPLLVLMDTPDNVYPIARDYLVIIMAGMPFIAIYNVYASVLRGIGDSKVPFYAVLISSLLNVVLDLVFVMAWGWGAVGAAVASVISQVAMAVYIVIYAHKKYEILRLNGRKIFSLIDRRELREGSSLALPITIQSVITSFGNLFLQGFMNGLGSATVAAITSAYRVDSIFLLPIVNVGTAISIFTSRSLGEGDEYRARRSLKVGLLINFVCSIVLVFTAYGAGGWLVTLFGITPEAEVIGDNFFKALSIFYIMFGFAMSLRGYIEGRGLVVFSGVVSVLSLVVRICLSYLLVSILGNLVIAYAEGISWCFIVVVLLVKSVCLRKTVV